MYHNKVFQKKMLNTSLKILALMLAVSILKAATIYTKSSSSSSSRRFETVRKLSATRTGLEDFIQFDSNSREAIYLAKQAIHTYVWDNNTKNECNDYVEPLELDTESAMITVSNDLAVRQIKFSIKPIQKSACKYNPKSNHFCKAIVSVSSSIESTVIETIECEPYNFAPDTNTNTLEYDRKMKEIVEKIIINQENEILSNKSKRCKFFPKLETVNKFLFPSKGFTGRTHFRVRSYPKASNCYFDKLDCDSSFKYSPSTGSFSVDSISCL